MGFQEKKSDVVFKIAFKSTWQFVELSNTWWDIINTVFLDVFFINETCFAILLIMFFSSDNFFHLEYNNFFNSLIFSFYPLGNPNNFFLSHFK